MNFFALPLPNKYFHKSIYENFQFPTQHDLMPGSFSFLYYSPKYFLNLQTNKATIGLNDNFSFSMNNYNDQISSSISLQMPNDLNIILKSPREFEAKLQKNDNFFRLTSNSFFYTGIYPFRQRDSNYDMIFSFHYPTPISLMCQFLRPGGCFGNSVELLPNVSLYSIFGKANYRNLVIKGSYSTCDKYIFKCLLGISVKHKGPFIHTSYSATLNNLDFSSGTTNADDNGIIRVRNSGSITNTLRFKLKFSKMVNSIIIWKINSYLKPNFGDFSFAFNFRRKIQIEETKRNRREKRKIKENESEDIDKEYIKKYNNLFWNLKNFELIPFFEKLKYIDNNNNNNNINNNNNNDDFNNSMISFKLRNDVFLVGVEYPINKTVKISICTQYTASKKKCAFQFDILSIQ